MVTRESVARPHWASTILTYESGVLEFTVLSALFVHLKSTNNPGTPTGEPPSTGILGGF